MPCPSMGPNHFGRVPIVLDKNNWYPFKNHFGTIEGQDIRPLERHISFYLADKPC